MFESICTNQGTVKTPVPGHYDAKGGKTWTSHTVTYFIATETRRDEKNGLQSIRKIYCKGLETEIPAGSLFVDADGRTFDIAGTKVLYDHFNRKFEFSILYTEGK